MLLDAVSRSGFPGQFLSHLRFRLDHDLSKTIQIETRFREKDLSTYEIVRAQKVPVIELHCQHRVLDFKKRR